MGILQGGVPVHVVASYTTETRGTVSASLISHLGHTVVYRPSNRLHHTYRELTSN